MSTEQFEQDEFLSTDKAITKADLAECLFKEVGLNKREAKDSL